MHYWLTIFLVLRIDTIYLPLWRQLVNDLVNYMQSDAIINQYCRHCGNNIRLLYVFHVTDPNLLNAGEAFIEMFPIGIKRHRTWESDMKYSRKGIIIAALSTSALGTGRNQG
jgi:hypothetical protein